MSALSRLGRNWLSVALLALAVLCGATVSQAGTLYVTANSPGDTLLAYDISGGTTTTVGPIETVPNVLSAPATLAYDPATGTMYTLDLNTFLYPVDINTGLVPNVLLPTGFNIADMTFDAGTNTLYGSASTMQLVSIDTGTGAGTVVGDFIDTNPSFPFPVPVGALAYDPNTDTFWGERIGTGELVSIDPVTAAVTVVASFTGISGFGGPLFGGFAFDPATSTLYGLGPTSGTLYEIDTSTAAATSIGTLSGGFSDFWGIEFVASETAAIPEPSCLALLVVGSASLLGYRSRRRRRTA